MALPPTTSIPHPGRNTVHVYVNPDTGDITFHPSVIHVGAGTQVTWLHVSGGPFTIHFSGRSPFGGGRASLHSRGEKLVSPPIAVRAGGHRFAYSVAAAVSSGGHQGKIATGGGGVLAVNG